MRLKHNWSLSVAASNIQAIDPRILTIGIEVNDRQNIYGSGDPRSPKLNIKATGIKYANANQDECEITITNLKEDTRNFILNETSPFNLNPKPKRAYVYAGRQSYGSTWVGPQGGVPSR